MNEYRFARLFLILGPAIAVLCFAVFAIIAVGALLQGFIGWIGVVLVALTGAVIAFLVLVFVDLTRLIVDMLLPR